MSSPTTNAAMLTGHQRVSRGGLLISSKSHHDTGMSGLTSRQGATSENVSIRKKRDEKTNVITPPHTHHSSTRSMTSVPAAPCLAQPTARATESITSPLAIGTYSTEHFVHKAEIGWLAGSLVGWIGSCRPSRSIIDQLGPAGDIEPELCVVFVCMHSRHTDLTSVGQPAVGDLQGLPRTYKKT